MGTSWAHLGTSVVASFLASLVECVEALTVILAVGSVRGWRSALSGTATALAVLLVLILALGRALTRVPLHTIQLVVGVLLLLFGLRWLRKAILRSAGLIPLHDEEAAFAKNAAAMRSTPARSTSPPLQSSLDPPLPSPNTFPSTPSGWDRVAFGTAFNITMLEGTEVVFIVIAIGAGGTGMLLPAGLGAVAALLVVAALGVLLHRPLARVPENMLKFTVGILLSAFGTFWVGEGMDLSWPGNDWSIPGLVAAYWLFAVLAVLLCRRVASSAQQAPARRTA